MDTYKNLLELKERTKNRDIYIWGAKITGAAMGSVALRNGFDNIKAFIDSNPFAVGKILYGKKVISPDDFWSIVNLNEPPFIIVGAAIRAKEIYKICEEHGLKEEEDFCWADDFLGPIYEFDLISTCNLSCPSCPQNNYKRHTPATMSLEKFKRSIQHIKEDTPNVAYIPLFCWTEPLLRKDLVDFLRVLKDENVLGIISTNFSLEVPHLVDIIKLQPEYFRVSMSGYYQETYERAHRGGNINLVKSNMYKLRYLLDKYSPNTFVEVYYHEYNYSPPEELEKWREVCNELGFTIFSHSATVNPLEHIINYMTDNDDASRIVDVLKTLKFDFKDGRIEDLRDNAELCYSFNNMFCVTAAGKVICCDCAYDEEKSLIAEDIENTTYLQLMEAKRKNEICQKCLELGYPNFLSSLSSSPKKSKKIL